MKYYVTLASYAITGNAEASRIPIPKTESYMVMDTDSGTGQAIWWGYLQMRQAGNPMVKLTAAAPEQEKFAEAINLFYRFLAGYGSDNCRQVKEISPV